MRAGEKIRSEFEDTLNFINNPVNMFSIRVP